LKDYYKDKLSADKLFQCYKIAPPRVRQYFKEEINYVLKKIKKENLVLDLGCGYGRVIPAIAKKAGSVIGIDTSLPSLNLGNSFLKEIHNTFLMQMNAVKLSFSDNTFDVVICIQNGISAFHENKKKLIKESIRVTKPGGTILFSSCFEKF
jgi:ubiquinone/menaquinone biosynthesis C-methylase UbiE